MEQRDVPGSPDLNDALGLAQAGLTERVAEAMRSVARAYVETIVAALAARGFEALTAATVTLLAKLPDRGITAADLARATGRTKQAAGKLIAELEQNGYVVRAPDPDDRRGFLIRASERGREALAIGAEVKDQLADRAAGVLGAKSLERLHRDLAALEAAFRDAL
ncbi:MarR family winged helix-turn-helix transcriptional regulator [Erythrobacter sp. NE805]|uniref:MarR family winged helix-turn-helix transcriptional regulator n=1 Tax=Erythrobacter sp. NE805 TaxID=3389875 RepID=UPI00396B2760